MRRLCIEIARECSKIHDFIAGHTFEKKFIQYILSQIDYPELTYHLMPLEVLHWKDKYTIINTRDESFKALSLPLTCGGLVKAKLTDDLNNCSGKILITPFPEDLDDAKFIYIKAFKNGAIGLIFIDPYPETFRRIVITSREDYTWSSSTPLSIPVVSVPKNYGEKLKKYYLNDEIEIHSDVEMKLSTSYNIIVNFENRSEKTVVISAHYDHWLCGFSDNCLGVGLSIELFREVIKWYRSDKCRKNIKLILFTAEELGSPKYSTLYWAYGSQMYVKWLGNEVEHIEYVLNLDVIGRRPIVYTTSDVKMQLPDMLDVNIREPIPYFDSLNFEIMGVPTITISSIDHYWDVYHSSNDNENNVEPQHVEKTLKLSMNILRHIITSTFNTEIYLKYARNELEKIGIGLSLEGTLSNYMRMRRLLSMYLVEYFMSEVSLTYVDSIFNYLQQMKYKSEVPLRVEKFGTGEVILEVSTCKDRQNYINNIIAALSDCIRCSLKI